MTDHQPPTSKQGMRHRGSICSGTVAGGGRIKEYLHAITNEQASYLTGDKRLTGIKERSGADVQFDLNQSPVPGMKAVIIRGVPKQIEAAVRMISQMTHVEVNLSTQAEKFWLQWVEAAFPDLDSRAYFLPPVYVNRVPMTTQSVAGQDVRVFQSPPKQNDPSNQMPIISSNVVRASIQPATVLSSDIRDDTAFQRVHVCLKQMSNQNGEVLIGMSQLRFGKYLNEPCYAAAAAYLPTPKTFPTSRQRQGNFDMLLIHRLYGFIVCEVNAFGDSVKKFNMSPEEIDMNNRKRLSDSISKLNKAEAMLSHLVSDIAPGLRITKTIAFPNLTAHQVQQAISNNEQVAQDLSRCLGTTRDPANMTGLCLCSDQLSDPKTPWDVSSHVLRELGHWWQRRVAGAGPDTQMTKDIYMKILARFCGPATTVSVPCTCPPRVSVKTLGQAVWCTGECYIAVITLFPEQLHLLNTAPPTLFVTGPPGTGKTVVLLLMAIEWLRCGHHVYIVSTCYGSRMACKMLHHLLLQNIKTKQEAGVSLDQLHLIEFDFTQHFTQNKDVEVAVNCLKKAMRNSSLYVIADEVGCESSSLFETFCEKLLTQVPNLHFWAASFFLKHAATGWQEENLTRPLRSPPAVVREVEQDEFIQDRVVPPYSERGVPDHTDGPPVKRIFHRSDFHSGRWPGDCTTCGEEVASFLHSLRGSLSETPTNVATTRSGTTPSRLQWRDMLVLYMDDSSDNKGIEVGLKLANIPVRVMKPDDDDAAAGAGAAAAAAHDDDIYDIATARSDVVWVARGRRVAGVERKVVVCVERPGVDLYVRLLLMSRCTSQLVIVSPDH